MAIVIDGVTLPDIPADALEQYQYAVIARVNGDSGEYYGLYCANAEFFHMTGSSIGVAHDTVGSMGDSYMEYRCSVDASEWIPGDGTWDGGLVIDGTVVLEWSNHDIQTVEFDSGFNLVPTGVVYFSDSTVVYEEFYAVRSDWLIDMSRQVRRLCQSGNRRTVDAMLEDLTACVVPTDYLRARVEGSIAEYSSDVATRASSFAFAGCIMLKSVSLPNATSVGQGAFQNCFGLESVNLPKVTSLGNSAFAFTTGLTSAEFPAVTETGRDVFASSAVERVDFHCLEQLRAGAFFCANHLTTLIIRTTTGICKLMYEDSKTGEVVEGYMLHFDGVDTKPFVYVPSVLLADYQANAAWSASGVTFCAIEDYPEICGT